MLTALVRLERHACRLKGRRSNWEARHWQKHFSPETLQNDVAKATNSATGKDAKAAQEQAAAEASASKNIQSAPQKANAQTASAAADTALTEAEGRNKIALEQCEALSGDFQQACKD